MTVINLDSLMTLKKKFLIAGKEREIAINDKTLQYIADNQAKIASYSTDLDNQAKKLDDKDNAEEIYQEGKALIDKLLIDTRETCEKFFDQLFGKGTGKEIYHYYDESTQAMTFVINAIYNEVQVAKKENKQAKKQAFKKSR